MLVKNQLNIPISHSLMLFLSFKDTLQQVIFSQNPLSLQLIRWHRSACRLTATFRKLHGLLTTDILTKDMRARCKTQCRLRNNTSSQRFCRYSSQDGKRCQLRNRLYYVVGIGAAARMATFSGVTSLSTKCTRRESSSEVENEDK